MSREIVNGTLYYPNSLTDESKDLLKWLLDRDPNNRPSEFSQVKNHKFFEDIHWGKFLKKRVVPPWLPSLYEWHYNPRFTSIPIDEVFGSTKETQANKERGSFYLELNPDSLMIEKLSMSGFDYESIINQENPLNKIYNSED